MINNKENIVRRIIKRRKSKFKKPLNIPVYDIPQLTDERWNELAEKNKMLRMKDGEAV